MEHEIWRETEIRKGKKMNEAVKLWSFVKHYHPKLKADYFLEVIERDRDDPAKFWWHMKTLLDRNEEVKISKIKNPNTGILL